MCMYEKMIEKSCAGRTVVGAREGEHELAGALPHPAHGDPLRRQQLRDKPRV